jgi:mRNA interferase RelE/StbE
MTKYHLDYTREARSAIDKLPGNYRQRIRRIINALALEPRPSYAKGLRERPGRYRIQVDSWRIIYQVFDDAIVVLVLAVRKKTGPETYEGLDE